ncbi:MAG: hypothetical protein V4663_12845 [Bacteroidota bacterium]
MDSSKRRNFEMTSGNIVCSLDACDGFKDRIEENNYAVYGISEATLPSITGSYTSMNNLGTISRATDVVMGIAGMSTHLTDSYTTMNSWNTSGKTIGCLTGIGAALSGLTSSFASMNNLGTISRATDVIIGNAGMPTHLTDSYTTMNSWNISGNTTDYLTVTGAKLSGLTRSFASMNNLGTISRATDVAMGIAGRFPYLTDSYTRMNSWNVSGNTTDYLTITGAKLSGLTRSFALMNNLGAINRATDVVMGIAGMSSYLTDSYTTMNRWNISGNTTDYLTGIGATLSGITNSYVSMNNLSAIVGTPISFKNLGSIVSKVTDLPIDKWKNLYEFNSAINHTISTSLPEVYYKSIKEPIENTTYEELDLGVYLAAINSQYETIWKGAIMAWYSKNPDKVRQSSSSIRQIFLDIFNTLAPKSQVMAWSMDSSLYLENGQPTHKAKLLYICRSINDKKLVNENVRNITAHLYLLNSCTHRLDSKEDRKIIDESIRLLNFLLDVYYELHI